MWIGRTPGYQLSSSLGSTQNSLYLFQDVQFLKTAQPEDEFSSEGSLKSPGQYCHSKCIQVGSSVLHHQL